MNKKSNILINSLIYIIIIVLFLLALYSHECGELQQQNLALAQPLADNFCKQQSYPDYHNLECVKYRIVPDSCENYIQDTHDSTIWWCVGPSNETHKECIEEAPGKVYYNSAIVSEETFICINFEVNQRIENLRNIRISTGWNENEWEYRHILEEGKYCLIEDGCSEPFDIEVLTK